MKKWEEDEGKKGTKGGVDERKSERVLCTCKTQTELELILMSTAFVLSTSCRLLLQLKYRVGCTTEDI